MNTFLLTLQRAFLAGNPDAASKTDDRASVSTVARLIHWAIRGDLPMFTRGLADDVSLEVQTPEDLAWVRMAAPPDAVVQTIRHTFAAVRGHIAEVTSVTVQGDTVVVAVRDRGERVGPAGRYSRASTEHFTLSGGKLAAFREVVSLVRPSNLTPVHSPVVG